MCCHKKCINKCQNATVCGPVDCSSALQQTNSTVATPEFMVTEADIDTGIEPETEIVFSTDDKKMNATTPTASSLEVHRSSLTGLLAQGIKRVNSANNLAIPGIVSSIAGVTGSSSAGASVGGGTTPNSIAKSLPPTPQHTPSR